MGFFSKRRHNTHSLSACLGHHITMAITNPHGANNKPEISLFIGVLREIGGNYTIVTGNGKNFKIPKEWLSKVKLMDEKIKLLLGGSDLLLPVTKSDVESAGFTYQRDPNGYVDIQVTP